MGTVANTHFCSVQARKAPFCWRAPCPAFSLGGGNFLFLFLLLFFSIELNSHVGALFQKYLSPSLMRKCRPHLPHLSGGLLLNVFKAKINFAIFMQART